MKCSKCGAEMRAEPVDQTALWYCPICKTYGDEILSSTVYSYVLQELEFNKKTKLTMWRARRSDGKTVRLSRHTVNRLNGEGRVTGPQP